MRQRIVTIDGLKWWETEIGDDVEYEPVEVQARELTVIREGSGKWRLERVYSYAKPGRAQRDIRITSDNRYTSQASVFRVARSYLENPNTRYE